MTQPHLSSAPPPPASGRAAADGPSACDCASAGALWQYLKRIEGGLDQIESRIDRLYVAIGGGTVLLAAISFGAAFIARSG